MMKNSSQTSPGQGPKKNTILNYFSRTPSSKASPPLSSNGSNTPKNTSSSAISASQNTFANTFSTPKALKNGKSRLSTSTPVEGQNSTKKVKFNDADKDIENRHERKLFDVVWAKLSGYPWWPSIVCADPASQKFEMSGKIHVQFFDDPVSHSWIRKRDLRPFTGSVEPGIPVKLSDLKLKKALELAEEALDLKRADRFELISDLSVGNYTETDTSGDSENLVTPSKRKKHLSKSDNAKSPALDTSTQRKRQKKQLIDSDSGDESEGDDYKPPPQADDESSDDSFSENSDDIQTPTEEDDDDDDDLIEVAKSKKKNLGDNKKAASKKSLNSSKTSTKFLASKTTINSNNNNTSTNQAVTHIEAADRDWPHLSYPFLQPDRICDANRRKMLTNDGELNPDYDPSTLHVPLDFLNKQTPALRQWWQFKAANFDTILFFKMGKFYELFHMDAVIATKELQIMFMRGDNAHAGFPEKSFKRYADGLIQSGYKVARIEQTENPKMMEERVKATRGSTKFDKVVKREICRISSIGTRCMSDIDSDAFRFSNTYLYAFTCRPIDEISFEFGLTFIDTSIGKFHLSQFKDDQHLSKLRTLMCHHSPGEIIYAGDGKVAKLIEQIFPNARTQRRKQFWPARKTLEYVAQKEIWNDETCATFRDKILDSADALQLTCLPAYDMSVTSLGGIIEYLETALIADDLLSMRQFELYIPPDGRSHSAKLTNYLVLDSATIKNLEIFRNLRGETERSLFDIIDQCQTPFGKRLLHRWLCLPLCDQRRELESRQDAVRELSENVEITSNLKNWCTSMRTVPDLERMLTLIHTQSSLKRTKDHPDSRAILFEEHVYRRRRIMNFLNTLDGFECIGKLVQKICACQSIKSQLLRAITNPADIFDDVRSKIAQFRDSFDAVKARAVNEIIPAKGVDAEYDDSIEQIEKTKRQLDIYLQEQSKFFKARVTYVNAGKLRYLLEVPEVCAKKIFDSDETYDVKNSRKGFKRYHTPALLRLIERLEIAEAKRENVLKDIFRRLLERFDHDYTLWSAAIEAIATLDALISLAKTKQIFELHDASACLPQIIWNSDCPRLEAENLRNACLIETRELIANDLQLDGGTLVLTGPNMAGKTTLMRSVGLMVILAQIGAYVPASRCTMTPVDRIFTRIGAYDQVIESQSTFMVELNETVSIMRHANENSLVLVDELGRGTSTFDGIAIAHAVLEELAQTIRCRCIFSTHFHSIVDELMHCPNIKIAHMAYVVENENSDDPTEEDVVFLYKLTDGICSKSYGYNVAKMAGIPRDVLRNAYKSGHAFELQVESCRLLDAFIRSRRSNKPLSEEKIDQLAQFLSEIVITRKSNNLNIV